MSTIEALPRANKAFPWDGFDTEDYHKRNYLRPLRVDRELRSGMVAAVSDIRSHENWPQQPFESTIDVCGGGVPNGLLAPLVKDGGTMWWTDFSQSNVEMARQYCAAGKRGDLGIWQAHEDQFGELNPEWVGCITRACELGKVEQMSIFDLPKREFDAATMHHGAESATEDLEEWRKMIRCFVGTVVSGGLVVMSVSKYSTGYEVGGKSVPAVPIGFNDIFKVMLGEKLVRKPMFFGQSRDIGGSRDEEDEHDCEAFSWIAAVVV